MSATQAIFIFHTRARRSYKSYRGPVYRKKSFAAPGMKVPSNMKNSSVHMLSRDTSCILYKG